MTALPESKLDTLLARHAALEAELLGQVNSETYVRITRELSELTPVVDAVKAYRSAVDEIGGIDGDYVKNAVRGLRRHEFLYIGRFAAEDEVSPAIAIVSAA